MTDTSDSPEYHYFMDAAYSVGDKVELITPGRFLFNAGKTPKEWNEKMLKDSHLKVLLYEPVSSNVFNEASFKGGVAVTYRDNTKDFGEIGVFSKFKELNTICKKVIEAPNFASITSIVYLQNKFDLDKLYQSLPQVRCKIGSDGKEQRLTTSIFDLEEVFSQEKKKNTDVKNEEIIKKVVQAVLKEENVLRNIEGKTIKKVIVVKNKIVNITFSNQNT